MPFADVILNGICVILNGFSVILSEVCVILSGFCVILSEAKDLIKEEIDGNIKYDIV